MVNGFNSFQKNIPFVASTTLQMRDAAKTGELTGYVLESQQYLNTPELNQNYKFTPFGVKHDNPLYSVGEISDTKKAILAKFAEHCKAAYAGRKKSKERACTKYYGAG